MQERLAYQVNNQYYAMSIYPRTESAGFSRNCYNIAVVTIYTSTDTVNQNEKSLRSNDNIIDDSHQYNPILSPFITNFLKKKASIEKEYDIIGQPVFRVNEVLGSLALFYERIRNVVEFKGENVLRRNAIERILRRLLREHSGKDTKQVTKLLLKELILARYLVNNSFPETKVIYISLILDKYLNILSKFVKSGSGVTLSQATEWFWGIASSEIEETIDKSGKEIYVELMFEWFKSYFNWQEEGILESDKNIQIYISIQRALAKSDDPIIRYRLISRQFMEWKNPDEKFIENFISNFSSIYLNIENQINFPNKYFLYRVVQKHVAPFNILENIINSNQNEIESIFTDINSFENKIVETCKLKYNQIQKKVNRGITRSIIYIFITKVFLALLLEVPYELYRFDTLRLFPLSLNVIVPPGLMWLIGISIRAPGDENTKHIIAKLKTVIYKNTNSTLTSFSLIPVKRNNLITRIFAAFYLIVSFVVFASITYVLLKLQFTFLGVLIFFAFLSLVILFGFRVRFTANELKVTSDKDSLLSHIFDNLTLPFLRVGLFLSKSLAKINFFSILLDFLIEAPLKSIIQIVSEWANYIREKKEEVVEVPE